MRSEAQTARHWLLAGAAIVLVGITLAFWQTERNAQNELEAFADELCQAAAIRTDRLNETNELTREIVLQAGQNAADRAEVRSQGDPQKQVDLEAAAKYRAAADQIQTYPQAACHEG